MERGRMELGHDLPGASKKGCEHVDMSQTARFSRYRSLASSHLVMYSFRPLFFLPPFSLRWVVLGISCHVPFVLIFRVWWPLFTILHLYFGLCYRDVGIYFPTLCACVVHDVCIYIYIYIHARPFQCDWHSLCHPRQAMPNFCHESKVTCHRIFAVEI